jgi:hypothetical protein
MKNRATALDALAFVREHGVVLAQVRQEHTPSGRHANREVPFPGWVPPDVAREAKAMGEKEALAAFGAWISK